MQKSYLFGTIHAANEVDYQFVNSMPQYHEIMERVDAVGTKFDFSDTKFVNWYAGRMRVYARGKYPAYAYLADSITSYPEIFKDTAEYHYVEKFLREFKKQKYVRPFKHEKLKPSFTILLIGVYKELQNMFQTTNDSTTEKPAEMDAGIFTHAKELGKRMIGLESTEYEIEHTKRSDSCDIVIGDMPTQAHDLYVYCRMENGDTVNVAEEFLGEIVKYYKRGDLSGLLSEIQKMKERVRKEHPSKEVFDLENDELVLGRNTMWMPTILSNIKQCACLFAVGALHLPGEEGLINVLRKEGYTVEPVK